MNFSKSNIKSSNQVSTLHDADYILFILVSVLVIMSIIFSYSLTVYTVEFFGYSNHHFFIRQLGVGILSIFIMWFLARTDPEKIVQKVAMSFFVIFFLLMLAMPILPAALVTESGGANRWIRLPGFSLSPVEFFKIGFVYFIAWSFNRKILNKPKQGLIGDTVLLAPYFIFFFIVVFVIAFLQKDLGQVVLLGAILLSLIIFANRSIKILIVLGVLAVVGFIGLIIAAPHRIQRIHSWWSMVQDTILAILPSSLEPLLRIDDLPEPYQVSYSLRAISNGGFLGQGVGLGDIKLGFLSEVHTDFVLAGITEELGYLGLMFIAFIVILIIWRIFKISRRVENQIFHLFSVSVALMIVVAFVINSYGISGMAPIKGIAVPFLSYGGSSMLAMSIAVGLVLSISRSTILDLKRKDS